MSVHSCRSCTTEPFIRLVYKRGNTSPEPAPAPDDPKRDGSGSSFGSATMNTSTPGNAVFLNLEIEGIRVIPIHASRHGLHPDLQVPVLVGIYRYRTCSWICKYCTYTWNYKHTWTNKYRYSTPLDVEVPVGSGTVHL